MHVHKMVMLFFFSITAPWMTGLLVKVFTHSLECPILGTFSFHLYVIILFFVSLNDSQLVSHISFGYALKLGFSQC